jgi:hypothetical protein
VPRNQGAVHEPRRMDPHVKTTLRSSGQAVWGTRKNQEKADPSPHPNGRKGSARRGLRVVRPHEDMGTNFLGMTIRSFL